MWRHAQGIISEGMEMFMDIDLHRLVFLFLQLAM